MNQVAKLSGRIVYLTKRLDECKKFKKHYQDLLDSQGIEIKKLQRENRLLKEESKINPYS